VVATVTVVVPVYNGATFIAATIDSALAQTYRDREIVVVDDGSTDDTPAVLDRFRGQITVIRQSNRGLSGARNRGLAAASGPYVTLLDADDLWDPTFLDQVVERLAAAGEHIAGVCAGWEKIDADGHPIPGTRRVLHGSLGLREFLLGCLFPMHAVLLRHSSVLAIGGFDESLRAAEDWDFWLRLTAAGGTLGTLERCLCSYRVHPGGWSRNPERLREGAVRALEKLYATPALPADVHAVRASALATVFLGASVPLFALGRAQEGARELRDAARARPQLLLEDETYYAIICAEQPEQDKMTARDLDLSRGEARLLAALDYCFQGGAPSLDRRFQRRARGQAYRALAQLAYRQRRMDAVRRYAGQAVRADWSLSLDWPTVAPWLKSFAGAALVERLSRWRRG
jgi:GT2 family glycosyltransferase